MATASLACMYRDIKKYFGQSDDNIDARKKINYYWNVPTFQCDSYELKFTGLAEKFGINQNENDRFRGNQIVILYDPGSFPAILDDEPKDILRNGGVPQQGDLTLHLDIFKEQVAELVPEEFTGVGIIDFESWLPIFRQNFGTRTPYKTLSVKLERERHPDWSDSAIKKEATRRFESNARKFMEQTLVLVKKLRPNATWGYYAYPYCFNMAPDNMKMACPNAVQKENDRINWLNRASDNLYPSIYFETRLTAKQNIQMVEGRVDEAYRIASFVKTETHVPKILPYFWFKYYGGTVFLTKEDLSNTFSTLSTSNVDGVVIGGSSDDVNTKEKCLELYEYVDNVLGPSLVNSF